MHVLKRDRLCRGEGKITVHREPHQRSAQKHRHEFFEIFIILSGEGTHVGGNFRFPLQAGDVGIINCRRAHGYEDSNQLNLVNILICENVIGQLAGEFRVMPEFRSLFNAHAARWREEDFIRRIQLSPRELSQVSDWVDRLDEETTRNEVGSDLVAKALLTLIIAVILRQYKRAAGRDYSRKQRPLGKVLSWIESNLDKDIRICDIANLNGMSVRSFQRYFSETMRCSPTAYIAQCRIRRSKEMLSRVGNPCRIADVAQACGFQDSNYFSAWFKRIVGLSPKEFRSMTN